MPLQLRPLLALGITALAIGAAGACGAEAANTGANNPRDLWCRSEFEVGETYQLDIMDHRPDSAAGIAYFERDARVDSPIIPSELRHDWQIVHDAKLSTHPEDRKRPEVRTAAADMDQWVTDHCVTETSGLKRQTLPPR